MKKIYLVVLFFGFCSSVILFSQDDDTRMVKGRYGECYQKKGFDSYGENQPPHTWGFKNIEIYTDYIYFYDAAYPGQSNSFLLLKKSEISRIVPNNDGDFTEIFTTIPSGNDAFMRITMRSSGSHNAFIAVMIK